MFDMLEFHGLISIYIYIYIFKTKKRELKELLEIKQIRWGLLVENTLTEH